MSALDRALAGARFLDRKLPGWRRHILRRRLDMQSGWMDPLDPDGCGCILAQLYPAGYPAGAEALGITAPVRLGFVAHGGGRVDEAYIRLTDAWRQVLREDLH